MRYRVWDKNRKRLGRKGAYVEVAGVTPDGVPFNIEEQRDAEMFCTVELEDVKVEYCSGLKDKNGNEIFEGDIVNIIYPILKIRGIVKFEYGMFSVDTGEGYCDEKLINCMNNGNEVEITGNINLEESKKAAK